MPASLAGSYNGLAFGVGTSYGVAGMDGFWDLPEVRENDLERTTGTGTVAGKDRKGGRTVTLTLVLIAATPTAYDTLVDNLIAATDVQPTVELPLRFWGNTRYIRCRPRRRSLPVDCGYPQRTGTAVIEFFASDPTVFTGAP